MHQTTDGCRPFMFRVASRDSEDAIMKDLPGSLAILIFLLLTSACQPTNTPTPAAEKATAPAPTTEHSCSDCIPVTLETLPRAETDLYFATPIKQAGGIGKFYHYREAVPIAEQTVVRANRDTFYSAAVFDLDAGPVTITLPDAGKRFMSMQL